MGPCATSALGATLLLVRSFVSWSSSFRLWSLSGYVSIDPDAIGPASADYIIRGLERAQQQGALVVLELDTPGGLDTSMRQIIRAILTSPVPVATYESPQGARAASAGTYIFTPATFPPWRRPPRWALPRR